MCKPPLLFYLFYLIHFIAVSHLIILPLKGHHYNDLMCAFFFFIYFWLCWVFISVRGLSLVAASGGHSSSQCAGLSLSQPLQLQTAGSRRAGSVAVAHGLSCSAACGILPDQGSNPCPLHWQADSQPLRHQGSPQCVPFCAYSCKISIFILLRMQVSLAYKLYYIRYFFFFFYYIYIFGHAACGILVPQPGIKPMPHPLQWKRGVLTTGPPRKSL